MTTDTPKNWAPISARRDDPPFSQEQLALAQGAQTFVSGVEELAALWRRLETPVERCEAMAAVAAAAAGYLNMVADRIATVPTEANGAPDLEARPDDTFTQPVDLQDGDAHQMAACRALRKQTDPSPETLQAQDIMASLNSRLDRLNREAQSDGVVGQGGMQHLDYCRVAWLGGNALALIFHLKQLMTADLTQEQRWGHQLAAWPCRENFLNGIHRSYTELLHVPAGRPHFRPFHTGLSLAVETARSALEMLAQPETVAVMEEATTLPELEKNGIAILYDKLVHAFSRDL